jgi:hypothetical protein
MSTPPPDASALSGGAKRPSCRADETGRPPTRPEDAVGSGSSASSGFFSKRAISLKGGGLDDQINVTSLDERFRRRPSDELSVSVILRAAARPSTLGAGAPPDAEGAVVNACGEAAKRSARAWRRRSTL